MMLVVDAALLAGTLCLLLLALTLLAQCGLAALAPERRDDTSGAAARPSVVVLIPANDEEASIGSTVRSIVPQLGPSDRLLVVADHCVDRTASIARAGGAMVIERTVPSPRGKSHALNQGLDSLEADPPDVVLVVDADCTVHPGAVARAATLAHGSRRPAQSCILINLPPASDLRTRISAFGYLLRNVVRPSGMASIGLPCQLMGAGMAFPWSQVRKVRPIGGHLVEDLQWGIDLAIAGFPPVYCPGAVISTRLPIGAEAARAQRQRWEHGHLQTLLAQVPRLLRAAVRQRRWDLAAMALDLAVPPLSLLALLAVIGVMAAVLGYGLGAPGIPAALSTAAIMAMLGGIVAAWIKVGRFCITLRGLLAVPLYLLWKAPIYAAFLSAPQRSWERRAARDSDR
jgi:cellulose synthase/poly-beta-1,6-N-acetylglucosamine synthase-like glycosyltransferase